ncbi:hypothetical protein EBR43_07000 [bacterium]|nr:hypothetical protein [bacterium]
MHYIVGTNFTVNRRKNIVLDSNNAANTRYERQLTAGTTYIIVNISRKESSIVYKLKDSTGKFIHLEFNNAREADNLIASFRNEAVPIASA